MRSEHDKLVAQVTKVDSILRDIIPRLVPYLDSTYRTVGSTLHQLVGQRPHGPHLRPPTYKEYCLRQNLYGSYYC